MNSVSFYLSGKVFLPPSFLTKNFAGQSSLNWEYFFFLPTLLAYKVSAEKSTDNLTGVLLYVRNFFLLLLLNLSLSMILDGFMICVLEDIFQGPMSFMNLDVQISCQIGKTSAIISLKKLSSPSSLSSPSETPVMVRLFLLMILFD